MPKCSTVSISKELLHTIFEGAKSLYPKETILMLRGKKQKDVTVITEFLVPPLANYGRGFANIRLQMLPMDFSLVGTVHSHPSGNINPSSADLNHFFGPVLMIVGYPFTDEKNVAAYNRDGERLAVRVTPT